jgi:seryl-tRNA synthetase
MALPKITKDNFVWKTKDKESTLDEMDVDYKIIALIHTIKLMNRNHQKYESLRKKKERLNSELELKQKQLNEEISKVKTELTNTTEKLAKIERSSNIALEKTEYFSDMSDVLEESLKKDHKLIVPSTIEDLWAFKRMLKEGIIKPIDDE